MLTYIAFYCLALLFTCLIIGLGSLIGTSIITFISKIVYSIMEKKLFIMGYHCFYPNISSVEKDTKCQKLLQTLRAVYLKNSTLNEYCTRISEERLPVDVFMNWTRSIAEDVFTAPVPSVKLDQWNHYLKSSLYHHISFFYSDFPEYDEREFGCLWGGIYFWLIVSFEKDMRDQLVERVVHFGSKSKPGLPYFYHFYNEARVYSGNGYYISNNKETVDECFEREFRQPDSNPSFISKDDVLNGFESLSVNERCNARQVFNDVLSECVAWKKICKEMKKLGWFKEVINPYSNVTKIINGDNVEGDKVQEKKVFQRIDNYQPHIPNQNVNFPNLPQDILGINQIDKEDE